MKFSLLIILIATLLLNVSCKKEADPVDWNANISLYPDFLKDISYRTAILAGTLEDFEQQIEGYGHCWDTIPNPDLSKNHSSFGPTKGGLNYESTLKDLTPGKKYYLRAYITQNGKHYFSTEHAFNTLSVYLPEVHSDSLTILTKNSLNCHGTLVSPHDDTIIAQGFCINTSGAPDISDVIIPSENKTGTFHVEISDLDPQTTYYIRAFARNSSHIAYGKELVYTGGTGIVSLDILGKPLVGLNFANISVMVKENGGKPVRRKGICLDTNPNPELKQIIADEGPGAGEFKVSLTKLDAGEIYFLRAFAFTLDDTVYSEEIKFVTSVQDYDGNIYKTEIIGNQAWMAENLKTTHYADGSPIPLVEGDAQWEALGTTLKGMCWHENSEINKEVYGGLYNWPATMNLIQGEIPSDKVQGACPAGWHVPDDSELSELEISHGLSASSADSWNGRGYDHGDKMKEVGTDHWLAPNENASNEYGFTALPAGIRQSYGEFRNINKSTAYWSSTIDSENHAISRSLIYDGGKVGRSIASFNAGFSVRCLKD